MSATQLYPILFNYENHIQKRNSIQKIVLL